MSFTLHCEDQAEVDRLWEALTQGGGSPGPCGWLKDRFGLSWQIVPRALPELLSDANREAAGRVMQAMLKMGKIDIAGLKRAHEARPVAWPGRGSRRLAAGSFPAASTPEPIAFPSDAAMSPYGFGWGDWEELLGRRL